MGRRTDLTNAALVVLMDGPLSGQWFHASDWQQRVASAAYMRDVHGEHPQPSLGYVRAVWMSDPIKHPRWKGVTGEPWYYRDAGRGQQPEQSENPPDARRLA